MNKRKRNIGGFLAQLCFYCIFFFVVFAPIIFLMIYVKVNFISEIIICIISFIIFTYIKIKIENKIRIKPNFNEKYYRDIPKIKPAILRFYISQEKYYNDYYDDYYDFYATILDLINREYLLFNFKTGILTINKNANLNNLEKFELNVIELLFYKRNQTEIEFTKLKYELENDKLFYAKIEAWKMFVILAANNNIYLDTNKKIDLLRKISALIVCIMPYVFLRLSSIIQINDIWCCFVCAIEIGGLFLVSINNKTYSKEVVEEIEKAKALSRYIKDYSMINEKDINDIVIWEGYLVYSVILDTPDKIKKYFDDIFIIKT